VLRTTKASLACLLESAHRQLANSTFCSQASFRRDVSHAQLHHHRELPPHRIGALLQFARRMLLGCEMILMNGQIVIFSSSLSLPSLTFNVDEWVYQTRQVSGLAALHIRQRAAYEEVAEIEDTAKIRNIRCTSYRTSHVSQWA
jgi:hypothetical protein